MTRLLLAVAALALLLAAWSLPVDLPEHGAGGLCTDEGAYRTRLCALALWSGESPASDRLLEWPDGAPVPYGKLAPAASAFALVRAIRAPWIDAARGELDEDLLALGAHRLGRVLAVLAVLALAYAAGKLRPESGEDARSRLPRLALLFAAGTAWTALALAPAADGGSVRASAWAIPLGALVLASAGALARARELADTLVLSIGAGLATGLAFAADPFAWPLALAPLCAVFLAARGERSLPVRDAVRSALFYAATAIFACASSAPAGLALLPRLEPLWQARAESQAEPWIDAVLLLLAAWLARRRASRGHALLAVVLVASGALRILDPRFAAAPLAPAGCALLAFVEQAWTARGGWRRPALAAALCALAVLGLAADTREYSPDAIAALRELRRALPASGPWNHALARQDYAVLANPRSAGAIAFHARRAVRGSQLPGALPGAGADEVAEALLAESTDALAARALALGAACVIVARRDLERLDELARLAARGASAPDGRRGSALRELLGRESAAGFELLLRVPPAPDPGGLAELAVWRLPAAMQRPPAEVRAR